MKKWTSSLLAVVLLAPATFAQEFSPGTSDPLVPSPAPQEAVDGVRDATFPQAFTGSGQHSSGGGLLDGNRDFPNFIGFLSNPLENIDPRAVTEVWPIFGSSWVSTLPSLPSGDLQVYGAGLYLALSDRLSVGLNQGGYAVANFSRNQPGRFLDHAGLLENRKQFGGERQGFLNLGGFAQYTVIADVPDQFLLTAGLRWEAPSGSSEVFQGDGPPYLAPYLTLGKEFGCFHVLATAGYEFPLGSSDVTTHFFYTNLHLDRRTFGWLYPLVEVNAIYHTSNVSLDLPEQVGFIDLDDFEASGNLVTLSVGANAVLVPNKLEVGAVYTTTLASQHNFTVNGLLAKIVYRY
jgi:hypothetical protein